MDNNHPRPPPASERHYLPPPPPSSGAGGAPAPGALKEMQHQQHGPPMQAHSQTAPPLPPQMFTTAAQLLDLTDKKLVLVLRDGRKMIGVLRSWDQFANLVLQDTIERIFIKDLYADIPRGIFLVRGENVLLLGEIDLDKDDYIPPSYKLAPATEVHKLVVQQANERKDKEKRKQKKLGEHGFEVEHTGEILF